MQCSIQPTYKQLQKILEKWTTAEYFLCLHIPFIPKFAIPVVTSYVDYINGFFLRDDSLSWATETRKFWSDVCLSVYPPTQPPSQKLKESKPPLKSERVTWQGQQANIVVRRHLQWSAQIRGQFFFLPSSVQWSLTAGPSILSKYTRLYLLNLGEWCKTFFSQWCMQTMAQKCKRQSDTMNCHADNICTGLCTGHNSVYLVTIYLSPVESITSVPASKSSEQKCPRLIGPVWKMRQSEISNTH